MDSKLLLKFIGYFPDYLSHCRVRFYAFFGQPLSKQLYTTESSCKHSNKFTWITNKEIVKSTHLVTLGITSVSNCNITLFSKELHLEFKTYALFCLELKLSESEYMITHLFITETF